jgi:very-short-patch-repair endonuclease
MFTQQPIYLKVTVPDFCWQSLRKVVYLDGIQVHRKKHVAQRDEEIDELLELQGWQVLRIPYDPPLSVGEVEEIVGQIKRFIGSDPDEEEGV